MGISKAWKIEALLEGLIRVLGDLGELWGLCGAVKGLGGEWTWVGGGRELGESVTGCRWGPCGLQLSGTGGPRETGEGRGGGVHAQAAMEKEQGLAAQSRG